MSLAWSFAKVKTPYGDVTTAHWAVPDDEANEAAEASQQQKHMLEKAENSLDTSEDELGAVLWNSNTVAANFLKQHFDSSTSSSASKSLPVVEMNKRKILELGAGVGCLGIGLAFGGCDVCVTDIPRLLPLMKVNVDLNRNKILATERQGKCFAAPLAWEMKTLESSLESWWMTKNANFKRTIVMCDALYGNPKGWPPLIRLLEKLMTKEDDEVINFCEQRVKGVEDGFLKLLGEENEIKRRNENTKNNNKRVWVWDLQELSEQSEMGMTIRRTIIKLVSEKERQDEIVSSTDDSNSKKSEARRRDREE